MTLFENVVFRLLGVVLIVAPNTGAGLIADIHVRVSERVARIKREEQETTLAA
jgi:hypothetical protein